MRRAGLLEDRVPAAAGLAFALPAIVDGAAALAHEGGVGFGHGSFFFGGRYALFEEAFVVPGAVQRGVDNHYSVQHFVENKVLPDDEAAQKHVTTREHR